MSHKDRAAASIDMISPPLPKIKGISGNYCHKHWTSITSEVTYMAMKQAMQALTMHGEPQTCKKVWECVGQVLELTRALLGAVEAQDRQLSTHEAACLLPCIVEKAGSNAVGAAPMRIWPGLDPESVSTCLACSQVCE